MHVCDWQMVIQPDDVIIAIQRFVDDRKEGGSAGDDRWAGQLLSFLPLDRS